jgi:hypothetical protein
LFVIQISESRLREVSVFRSKFRHSCESCSRMWSVANSESLTGCIRLHLFCASTIFPPDIVCRARSPDQTHLAIPTVLTRLRALEISLLWDFATSSSWVQQCQKVSASRLSHRLSYF